MLRIMLGKALKPFSMSFKGFSDLFPIYPLINAFFLQHFLMCFCLKMMRFSADNGYFDHFHKKGFKGFSMFL